MKKKVLLTSVMTIALCLCLIAGSTFALFTDRTSFNIAVTAGKVDVEAYATIAAVWSADGEAEGESDEFLIDEHGNSYVHVQREDNKTFVNGGTAQLTGAHNQNLTIERITPGDKVDVVVNVTNKSNVAILYRYTITINRDEGLATGMVLTVDDKCYEGFESYTSEWFTATAPEGDDFDIDEKMISVELPVYAGNEYQEKSVEYKISVEAVQGNAVTEDESLVTILPEAFQKAMNRRSRVTANGATVNLTQTLTLVNRSTGIVNSVIDGTNATYGEAATAIYMSGAGLTLGEGTTLIAGADYGILGMDVNRLTLEAGSKIVVPEGSDAKAIWIQNNTADFELILNDVGLFDGEIVVTTAGNTTIRVPDMDAYSYYVDLVSDGGDDTSNSITWIVNGEIYEVTAD